MDVYVNINLSPQWIIKCPRLCMQNIIIEHYLWETQLFHPILLLTFSLVLTQVTQALWYSWLPITRTLANWNLALTRTKVDFPWISFLQFYCNFTLSNSNPR